MKKKYAFLIVLFFLGSIVFGQNVGIGTTTPNNRLDVLGDGEFTMTSNGGETVNLILTNTGSSVGTASGLYFRNSAQYTAKIISTYFDSDDGDGRLNFFVSDAGTLTEAGHFTVNNNGTYFRALERALIGTWVSTTATLAANNSGTEDIFNLYDNSSEIFTVLDGGFTGIGTTTPDNRLDVFGKISLTQSAGDEMVIINDDIWQHGNGNQDFGDGGDHFIMASKETSGESAGIYGDGDHVTIWSPGDGAPGQSSALLYICDEDYYNNDGNPFDDGALRAYLNTSGNWVSVSDVNRKENVVPLSNSLEKILKIKTYSYDFKQNKEEIEKGQQKPHALGVIAQEVEKILPEVIEKSDAGDYFVSYTEFIPVLLNAVKEQNAIINQKEASIKKLESDLANLKSILKEKGILD